MLLTVISKNLFHASPHFAFSSRARNDSGLDVLFILQKKTDIGKSKLNFGANIGKRGWGTLQPQQPNRTNQTIKKLSKNLIPAHRTNKYPETLIKS